MLSRHAKSPHSSVILFHSDYTKRMARRSPMSAGDPAIRFANPAIRSCKANLPANRSSANCINNTSPIRIRRRLFIARASAIPWPRSRRLAAVGDRLVRRSAVLALGFVADYESNAVLGRALSDTDRGVRLMAETAIRSVWCRIGTAAQRQQLAGLVLLNRSHEFAVALRDATALIREAPWLAEVWNQRAIAQFGLGPLRPIDSRLPPGVGDQSLPFRRRRRNGPMLSAAGRSNGRAAILPPRLGAQPRIGRHPRERAISRTLDEAEAVGRRWRTAHAYPNGVSSQSPGLAAVGGLPRVDRETSASQLQRSCINHGARPIQPTLGLSRTQGSPPMACNPGLCDRTPIGVQRHGNRTLNIFIAAEFVAGANRVAAQEFGRRASNACRRLERARSRCSRRRMRRSIPA